MNSNKYESCLNYLYSQLPMYQRVGQAAYKTDLTNTVRLCESLGNPQNGIKFIHVAGTNGKTSTSHFIASILQEAGYKVGLYTSPHLIDFRERILINGEMVSKDFVIRFVDDNKVIFDEVKPSFFEMTVAMAFVYFKQENVDFAVIEVGLGGRLDSTNIITPIICEITNIGFDHVQFLGNTLQSIAIEKAGIIKNNVPVVISETQDEIADVFKNKAKESDAPFLFADKVFSVSDVVQNVDSLRFVAKSLLTGKIYNIDSALVGHYEIKNIIGVLTVIEEMSRYVEIPVETIERGIKEAKLRGRWDIIGRNPLTVCDTGHNIDGILVNMDMLKYAKYNKLHIVFGAVNDKDLDKIVTKIDRSATYYFCKPSIPRGMDVDILKAKFESVGIEGTSYSSCIEALKAAQNAALNDDLIYVGGSTFVVADILSAIEC